MNASTPRFLLSIPLFLLLGFTCTPAHSQANASIAQLEAKCGELLQSADTMLRRLENDSPRLKEWNRQRDRVEGAALERINREIDQLVHQNRMSGFQLQLNELERRQLRVAIWRAYRIDLVHGQRPPYWNTFQRLEAEHAKLLQSASRTIAEQEKRAPRLRELRRDRDRQAGNANQIARINQQMDILLNQDRLDSTAVSRIHLDLDRFEHELDQLTRRFAAETAAPPRPHQDGGDKSRRDGKAKGRNRSHPSDRDHAKDRGRTKDRDRQDPRDPSHRSPRDRSDLRP